jgi:SAM-dependent methyltransferase
VDKTAFDAQQYWEARLSERFDLTGVGTHGFNRYYNRWLYRAKLRALKKAFAQFDIQCEHKDVLDVGCGTGFFVDTYHALGARSITGIDITQKSIQALKHKYPHHTFVQMDIGKERTEVLGRFDIINAFDVLYHVQDESAFQNAVANLAQASRRGTYIFLTDLLGPTRVQISDHVTFRALDTYTEAFAQHGLEVLSTIPMYSLMNRPFPSWGREMGKATTGLIVRLDNLLAPALYFLDRFVLTEQRSNMKLLVGGKQ